MPSIDLAVYKAKPCLFLHGYWHIMQSPQGWFTPQAMPDDALRLHRGPVMLDHEPATWTRRDTEQMRTAMAYCNIVNPALQPFAYSEPQAPYWGDDWSLDVALASYIGGEKWAMLKSQDIIIGACYLTYVDDQPSVPKSLQYRFVDRNCQIVKAVAEKLRKPWGMTVWNHYHDAPSNGCILKAHHVPATRLREHVAAILAHDPDYLVHWGAREYFKRLAAFDDATADQNGGRELRDIWQAAFAADPRSDVEVWSEAMGVYRSAILEAA